MHTDEIDALWEYGDPAESERRFRAAIDSLSRTDAITELTRLELLTQVARTLGLRRQFDHAHAQLDAVQSELDAMAASAPGNKGQTARDRGAAARVSARLQLERGRAFNSAGERERARTHFHEAHAHAAGQSGGLEGLAVDALHMIAITHGGTSDAVEWNKRGLELAHQSSDAKARALIPAMLNNMAWDLHGLARFEEALKAFEMAHAAWSERGREKQIRIARWSVARCLRSLERHELALAMLRDLETEHTAGGTCDGFVLEEIAENLAALGHDMESRPYFHRAAEELAKDAWFSTQEASRLERLRLRG